jgi:hypothetical protein
LKELTLEKLLNTLVFWLLAFGFWLLAFGFLIAENQD